jgi:hypothetical protein
VSEHFLGREAKRKYLGLLQTLDESFTSQESWRVLDTLDIHFANFEEQIEKLSRGSDRPWQLRVRSIGRQNS